MAGAEGSASPWGSEDNARRYDAFARRYPMYGQTSRDLVALAGLSSGDVVVDLACGTGVTTGEILAAVRPSGRVVGVDGSPAMLGIARRRVVDTQVSWVCCRAEELDAHVTGPVDAVVCNSAIWQTDLAITAVAARNVLADGGRLVFNVGHHFLAGARAEAGSGVRLRPSLGAVMQAIAGADHDWMPPARHEVAPRRLLGAKAICELLGQAGFEVEQVEELAYERSPQEQLAWLRVPIFTERYLPGMAYAQRMAVLDKAWGHLAPAEAMVSRWSAFVAVAGGSARPEVTADPGGDAG